MEYEDVALKAINLLLSDIETGKDHRPAKQNILIKPKLIVGQSCGTGIL
jgi:DNA-binding LacI/PurR family transcriptional regulator